MNEQHAAGDQARKRETVADLLHQDTCRSESGGSDIRPAVVVDNNANDKVYNSDCSLRDDEGPSVKTGVTHLGGDREESRAASECKDHGCHCAHRFLERRIANDFVVGLVYTRLGSSIGSVLDTNGDGESEYWTLLVLADPTECESAYQRREYQ